MLLLEQIFTIDKTTLMTYVGTANEAFLNEVDKALAVTLRILNNGFNRRKLKDIKAYDIEQFLKKLRRDGRSDSCLAQCRGMLIQIFNKAEANDLVAKNPVRFAEKMRKGPPKRKEAFTAEEVQLLMDKKLPEDKTGWSIRLMLATGMRTQELLALEPRHISDDGAKITIEQAVVMEKGTAVIGTPKSFDSYRVIPVPVSVRYCARLLCAVNTTKHYLYVQESIRQAAIDKFSEAFSCENTERHHLDLVKTS